MTIWSRLGECCVPWEALCPTEDTQNVHLLPALFALLELQVGSGMNGIEAMAKAREHKEFLGNSFY